MGRPRMIQIVHRDLQQSPLLRSARQSEAIAKKSTGFLASLLDSKSTKGNGSKLPNLVSHWAVRVEVGQIVRCIDFYLVDRFCIRIMSMRAQKTMSTHGLTMASSLTKVARPSISTTSGGCRLIHLATALAALRTP